MVKLLVGLLKGAVIGGAVGYGAYQLGLATGFENAWLTYGLVGALVGLLVGRPIWALVKDQNSTTVIAILKAAFGFGIGCGLYAIVSKAWGPSWHVTDEIDVFAWAPTMAGAIGAVYGAFVELDDSIADDGKAKKPPADKPPAKPAKAK